MASGQSQLSWTAVRDVLIEVNDERARLVRERQRAIRSGKLNAAISISKMIHGLHRDYLDGALRAVSIRYSLMRRDFRKSDPDSSRYEFYKKVFGPEVAGQKLREWKDARALEEAQVAAHPLSLESFSVASVRENFFQFVESEKAILNNLSRLAEQKGNSSVVRGCWEARRQLRKLRLEGDQEISNFERDNPLPVDHLAEIQKQRETVLKFLLEVEKVAKEAGVIKDEDELIEPRK